MPLLITPEAWTKWQPVIEELHSEYEFPVNTKAQLNALLSCYSGEGTSFCTNQDQWRFMVDIVRSRDAIEDVITICAIKRPQRGRVADGWLITQICSIHGPHNATKVVADRNIGWYEITDNGLGYQHCCQSEITGPHIARVPWGSWEGLRLRVNQRSQAQEIASLRQQLRENDNEKSLKRKLSVVDLTEDDITESPTVKKLRKSRAKYKDAKAEAEDRAIVAEYRARDLERQIETLREELIQKRMLVTKKDKAIDDLRREYTIKDVSLRNLREEVARQKKAGVSGRNTKPDQHLESPIKIEEDSVIELTSQNIVLKGVVDRQKAEMQELELKLTYRNRSMESKRKQMKRLEDFIYKEVPLHKIPENLQTHGDNFDTHVPFITSPPACGLNGNVHPDRQALLETPSTED